MKEFKRITFYSNIVTGQACIRVMIPVSLVIVLSVFLSAGILSLAVLNGTVNANGLPTTIWYEYGVTNGSYSNTLAPQIVIGSNDKNVSISIGGLSSEATHYYRIAAQNSAGTSYGNENTFTTIALPPPTQTPTPTPTPTPTISPTLIPTPTTIDGNLSGQVTDAITGMGINGATVTVEDTGIQSTTGTVQGQDGIFVLNPLPLGSHEMTASAEGYYTSIQIVSVETGNPNPYTCKNIFNFLLLPKHPRLSCNANLITASPNVLRLKKEESGNIIITLNCSDRSLDVMEIVMAGIKSGTKYVSILPQSAVTNTCGQAVFRITATKQTGNAKIIFVTNNGLTASVTIKVKESGVILLKKP